VFLPALGNDVLSALEDQATLPAIDGRIAMTTDAYVVRPIFFPGGDIGSLAVHGTVNDLAVGGAIPLHLSAAFILEEGLPIADLERVVRSMQQACAACGVRVVAADTKVVERGKGDQIYITTTGVGVVPAGRSLSVHAARPGDCILLSGSLGDHGIAVLSCREGLEFETELASDSAPLIGLIAALLAAAPEIHCMRDPTRGGLSSALHEIAAASAVGIELHESAIPIRDAVRGACEMLGLDPLYVANEGKLVAIVPEENAVHALAAVRAHPQGQDAAIIGRVVAQPRGLVTLRSRIGGTRIVPLLAGEQLPRIC
jgi:hydrogenase expression/formation protein HypE